MNGQPIPDWGGMIEHNPMPKNPCCGYAGVWLGQVVSHTHWVDGQPHTLIVQEVQCPHCRARWQVKGYVIAKAHWEGIDQGASEAEQALALYAVEKVLEGVK